MCSRHVSWKAEPLAILRWSKLQIGNQWVGFQVLEIKTGEIISLSRCENWWRRRPPSLPARGWLGEVAAAAADNQLNGSIYRTDGMANGRGRIAQKAYQWRADMRTGSLPHFRSWSGLKTLLFSFSPSPVLSLLNCTYFFSVLICQLTRAFRHSLNTGIQVGSFSLCRHTFIDRSLLTFCLIFLVKKAQSACLGRYQL